MLAGFNLFWITVVYLLVALCVKPAFKDSLRGDINPNAAQGSQYTKLSNAAKVFRKFFSCIPECFKTQQEKELDEEIASHLSLKNMYTLSK